MVAVHFKELNYRDDNYGKDLPIRIFKSETEAKTWLDMMGYRREEKGYFHSQYHSEWQAKIHEVISHNEDSEGILSVPE